MDDLSRHPVRDGFRQRGSEITRLETFTDAAFAFSVTVLVIAGGQVPDSFSALWESLEEIPAFAASFTLILMFWHGHVQWSRRFGLEDTRSVLLSAALIFTILTYVVPLKVMTGQFFAWVSGGWLGHPFPLEDIRDLPRLFVLYGIGFVAMTWVMGGLNHHALSQRERLRLDAREELLTRIARDQWMLLSLPGILSVGFASLTPPEIGVWSGFAYMILPIVMPIFGVRASRRIARLDGVG